MSASTVPGLRRRGCLSPFRSLLLAQLKVAYGQRGISEKMGLGQRSRSGYLLLILLAVAFMPFIGLLYRTGKLLAAQSVAIAQPGLPVTAAVMSGQFIVFFIGMSGIMSTLYYASDLETLQSLPLTARQIIVSKVTVSYISQVLFSSVLVLPILIPLGLEVRTPLFWVSALLVDLTVPLIPLTLAVLVMVPIMRATKGLRRRDFLRVVFGLVFFVMILGLQSLNARMTAQGPAEIIAAISRRNGLVQVISRYYPPLRWAAASMTEPSLVVALGSLLLFVGVSAGSLALVSNGAQRWFLGGVGREVATGSAGRLTGADKTAQEARHAEGLFLKERSPSVAVALRDHRVLTRTPNFFLVTLTNMAIIPIMWVFSAVSGGDLRVLFGGFGGVPTDSLLLVLVGIQGVLATMNQVSSTTISREGATFQLSKTIPVPAKVQIRGKIGYSLAVTAVQLVTLLVPAALTFRLDPARLAVVAALGMLVSWPVTCLCVLNDLHNPRLKWTDPHQAMKGNLATLGAMLFSAAFLFAGGLVVRTALRAGVAGGPAYLLVAVLAVASGVVLQRYLENTAGRRYRNIEV